jgi:hypothetical protein
MGYPPSKEIVKSWELRRHLPFILPKGGDLIVVGKEDEELQLARRKWGKKGFEYIVSSYKPEKILIHESHGPIERAIPERNVTKITSDEYYRRVEPASELNEKYLNILRLL